MPPKRKNSRQADAPIGQEAAEGARARGGFWAWLSSIKLAVVLLSVIAVASLVGTLLPQQALGGGTDEAVHELYHEKFGTVFGGLMLRLSFHRLYGSAWYVGLLLLLTANTLACATKSVRRAARQAKLPAPGTTRDRVARMAASERQATTLPAQEAYSRALDALAQLGYATAGNESPDGSRSLVGRKWAWSAWASPALHFSLMFIVLGAVIGRLPGAATDSYLVLEEGETYHGAHPQDTRHMQGHALPKGLFDFDVKLQKFDMAFYPSGQVSEYASDVIASRDGKVLAEKKITVNYPLEVHGTKFYQSSWGIAALVLGVKAPDGTVEHVELPLEEAAPDPMGRRQWQVAPPPHAFLPSTGWMVFVLDFWHDYAVHARDGTLDRTAREPEADEIAFNVTEFPRNPAARVMVVAPGAHVESGDFAELGLVSRDHHASYRGHEISLDGVREWSGLQVRRDPGIPFLYAGFVLMVLSMMVALYLSPRTIRLHLTQRKAQTEAVMGGSARLGRSFDREFARLKAALRRDE